MTSRRLAAAALLVSACTASSRSNDARELSVVIQIDDTGVTIVGTAPSAAPVVAIPADDSPQLEFELRDAGDQLIASGLLPEPRRVRAEWFEGFSLRRTDIATAFGTAEIALPSEPGILIVFAPTATGRLELGRTPFAPDLAATGRPPVAIERDVLSQTRLVDHGDPATRIDIALIAEGYTETELGDFRRAADAIVGELERSPDFGPVMGAFNVWRIDVRSPVSGIGEPGVAHDTAFETEFGQGGVRRCPWFRGPTGLAAARQVGQLVGADVVAVIGRSDEAGGCASIVDRVLVFTDSTGGGALAHEMGHALFGLADEYDQGTCDLDVRGPNISASPALGDLPWGHLVGPDTQLPTTLDQPFRIGAFDGAAYCVTGMYRPQYDCRMRSIDVPMCAICRHAMTRTLGFDGPEQAACDDEIDNDVDAKIDCADVDCASSPVCTGSCVDSVYQDPAVDGTTTGAPDAAADSRCGDGGATSPDAMIGFTAQTSATHEFALESAEFDAVLSIRRGCGSRELACDDATGGTIRTRLKLTAGESVVIVVDGVGGEHGPFRLHVSSDACGNGTCEPGENGSSCPTDCCDALTPCDATHDGRGVEYCRSMNGEAYGWITPAAARPYCDDAADLCAARTRCGGETSICGSLPDGWRVDTGSCAPPATCGDGRCDKGETGATCGADCCDPATPCATTRAGSGGTQYCRAMNGAAPAWVTVPEADTYCDDPAELCTSTAVCDGVRFFCVVDGGWQPGGCTP